MNSDMMFIKDTSLRKEYIERATNYIRTLVNEVTDSPDSPDSPDLPILTASPILASSQVSSPPSSSSSSSSSSDILSAQVINIPTTPILRPTQYKRRKNNKSSFTTRLHSLPVRSPHINKRNIDIEIENYISSYICIDHLEHVEFDPGFFFKTKENEFPLLSAITKKIYSLPATSVPSECLFSSADMIQTDYRNRLNPSILESLTFLKNY